MKKKKIFILDTNVILHDYRCIYNFQENDIILPIPVLEELDRLKKGNELINFHAREFTRELDKLSGTKLLADGIELGPELGKLFIELGKKPSEEFLESFPEESADHRILAIADHIYKKFHDQSIILISKDINLRMKCRSLGFEAQDYENDKVKNLDEIYRGINTIEKIPDELISKLYEKNRVSIEEFEMIQNPVSHQYFILRGENSSVLAHYDPFTKMLDRVEKQKACGIEPKNSEQTFALDALMRPEVQLVSLTGKAGTGKTLLALAAGIQQINKKDSPYKYIFISRPVIELSNNTLGFLPGDVESKISPFTRPLFDNLDFIKNKYKVNSKEYQEIEDMVKNGKIVIEPLNYIRGRSLSNIFFIIDESQNTTKLEVKTIITRAGINTKIVFTGDVDQIDSPYLDSKSNGLSYLTDKMKGQDIFAHINLVKSERSYLAQLAGDIL